MNVSENQIVVSDNAFDSFDIVEYDETVSLVDSVIILNDNVSTLGLVSVSLMGLLFGLILMNKFWELLR